MAFCLAFILALLVAVPAEGHSAVTGSEGFVTGLSQPFLEIEIGLAIIGIGLFLGQQGNDAGGRAASLFLLTLILGLLSAFQPLRLNHSLEAVYILAIVAGLLIAAAYPIPKWLSLPFTALAGIVIGVGSVPDPASFAAIAFTTAGSLVCMTFLFLYAITGAQWLVAPARPAWLSVVPRIIGSWLFAIAMLVLAFTFRN